jgi:hypothetical protein
VPCMKVSGRSTRQVGGGGVGIRFLRASCPIRPSALRDGSLKRVLANFEGEDMPVTLLHREMQLPQAKVQSFVAFAAASLRKRMQGLLVGR